MALTGGRATGHEQSDDRAPEPLAVLADGFRILRAREEHVHAIVRLLADDALGHTREREPEHPAYRDAFRRIDEDPNQVLAVVVDDAGEVVGTLQLSFLAGLSRGGALRAQLEAVRVSSSCRGRGLGTRLLAWAIDHARQEGATLVQLTTDKTRVEAHELYRRLGFVASHEGMKLSLAPALK